MDNRAFVNPFPDYAGEKLIDIGENGKLDPEFSERLKRNINVLTAQLQTGLQHVKGGDSVYTGHTGIALLYLHLHNALPDTADHTSYLDLAVGYLQSALRHLGSGVYTFLCGDAGTLAIAAVVYNKLGDMQTSKEYLDRLMKLHSVVAKDTKIPDEHLYGRAGYLAAVMFVQSHLGKDAVDSDAVSKVVKSMLVSGQTLSQKKGWKPPLMYAWYKEYYLGAAHGLAGILYTLLLVRKNTELSGEIDKLVHPTVDYMLTLQFSSGNYPAVIGDNDDRLVHWCHGAPGWIYMWILAYQVYKDSRYLEAAERCGEVTWRRGLLKKGYGLCHGAAGNAYAFLALFRLTHDQKHLYRACKFAEWCFDYGKHGCRIPDTPFSLFEGMAGTIYFLADLLEPLKARFPAYEF